MLYKNCLNHKQSFIRALDGLLSSGDNGNDEEIRIDKPRP